jgi:hypothetical protein
MPHPPLASAIAVELANQSVAIFGGDFRQMSDERLDLLPAGLAYVICAAKLSGIPLHLRRVEMVLADKEAQLVAEPGRAIGRLRRKFPYIRFRLTAGWKRSDLFHRADPDSIRLAQRAIDSTRFSNTHLGATDSGGNVGWVSVAIPNKAAACRRCQQCGPKYPATRCRFAEIA